MSDSSASGGRMMKQQPAPGGAVWQYKWDGWTVAEKLCWSAPSLLCVRTVSRKWLPLCYYLRILHVLLVLRTESGIQRIMRYLQDNNFKYTLSTAGSLWWLRALVCSEVSVFNSCSDTWSEHHWPGEHESDWKLRPSVEKMMLFTILREKLICFLFWLLNLRMIYLLF